MNEKVVFVNLNCVAHVRVYNRVEFKSKMMMTRIMFGVVHSHSQLVGNEMQLSIEIYTLSRPNCFY